MSSLSGAMEIKKNPEMSSLMSIFVLRPCVQTPQLSDTADVDVHKKFGKNSVHRCRVIDLDFADNILILSLKQ